MAARIELSGHGRELLIRFDYDKQLVEAVRQLPDRRFDPRARLWMVPAKHVDIVVGALLPRGFTLAPEVRQLTRVAEAFLPFVGGSEPPPAESRVNVPCAPTALTVGGLNLRVRDALRGAFPDLVWVVGEVLDFDKSAGRRHRFFSLVEKVPGEARVHAQVEAALFESKAEELAHKLAAAEPPLALRDGLEIRVLGRVDLYPQSGRFQLVIEDIDPAHTLGKLLLSRDQVLRELRAAGLAERNASLPLPRPALRIAVLASETSDGWHDFTRHLAAAPFAFEVTLFPVRVQGAALRASMLTGLDWFARHAAAHDVLCILRGGGSRTDLSGFDDREVAWAVARHPLKVLVGVGHERDRSVLDHIAVSFKTPTAVAAFLVDEADAEWQRLHARGAALAERATDLLADRAARLHDRGRRLAGALVGRLLAQRHAFDLAAQRLRHAALTERIGGERHRLVLDAQRLRHGTTARIARAASVLGAARVRACAAGAQAVERARGRLAAHEVRCRLLDPRAILQRGYAMVRRVADGKLAVDAAAIPPGEVLDLEFRDGIVRATAEEATIRGPARP